MAAATAAALLCGAAAGAPGGASPCGQTTCKDLGPGGRCDPRDDTGYRCSCSPGYDRAEVREGETVPVAPPEEEPDTAKPPLCVATCALLEQDEDCPGPLPGGPGRGARWCGGVSVSECRHEHCCGDGDRFRRRGSAPPSPAPGAGGGWAPLPPVDLAVRWEWMRAHWRGLADAVAAAGGVGDAARVRVSSVLVCTAEFRHLCVDKRWRALDWDPARAPRARAPAPPAALAGGAGPTRHSHLRVTFDLRLPDGAGGDGGAADAAAAIDACLSARAPAAAGAGCARLTSGWHACRRAAQGGGAPCGEYAGAAAALDEEGTVGLSSSGQNFFVSIFHSAEGGGGGNAGASALLGAGLCCLLACCVALTAHVAMGGGDKAPQGERTKWVFFWPRADPPPPPAPQLQLRFDAAAEVHAQFGGPSSPSRLPLRYASESPRSLRGSPARSYSPAGEQKSSDWSSDVPSVELQSFDFEIQRRVGEKLGIKWVNHTVLSDVIKGSPAQKQGLGEFVGCKATHVNGRPVHTLGEIQRLVQGVTAIRFTLVPQSPSQSVPLRGESSDVLVTGVVAGAPAAAAPPPPAAAAPPPVMAPLPLLSVAPLSLSASASARPRAAPPRVDRLAATAPLSPSHPAARAPHHEKEKEKEQEEEGPPGGESPALSFHSGSPASRSPAVSPRVMGGGSRGAAPGNADVS